MQKKSVFSMFASHLIGRFIGDVTIIRKVTLFTVTPSFSVE